MKKLKKTLIISMFITLPISIMFMIVSIRTMNIYFESDKIALIDDKGKRLYKVGLSQFHLMRDQLLTMTGIKKEADVNILLKKSSIEQLNENLPKSGFHDKKGVAFIDNELYKGKIRYRGDNYYHWLYQEKSWRVKTSKKNLYQGIRKLNFIIPKYNGLLNNHLSYQLAKSLHLLSPDSKLVDLSVNGVNNGIKLQVEQIDESFLRKNRRMPNDIYKGDNIGEKTYRGVSVSLFKNPSIWEKSSANNHYDLKSLLPLQYLVEEIKIDNHQLLDITQFAALSLLIDMMNSYHLDTQHNWVLSYDHYFEKMIPIVNDPVGWAQSWERFEDHNIVTAELLESLYRNYDFLREKYRVAKTFFNDEAENFHDKKSKAVGEAHRLIKKHEYTLVKENYYLNEKDSINAVNELDSTINKRLLNVKEAFLGDVGPKDYRYAVSNDSVRLYIDNSKLIKKIRFKLSDAKKSLENIFISYEQGGQTHQFDIRKYSKLFEGNRLEIDLDLLPNITFQRIPRLPWEKAALTPVTYDIKIPHIAEYDISGIEIMVENEHSEVVPLKKINHINVHPFSDGLMNILPLEEVRGTQHWSDTKVFQGFNLITDDIVIRPGTRIIMDENATLKVLGKVTARGTKEEPIIFEAKDKSKPWNAFALKDENANGSVFSHCIFKDGSGDKGELYEYTAMFSVHNVKDIVVENSAFYDSHRTDDMIHVIYSDAVFKNSKFVRSLSDALDVDISNVIVDNCEFIDSGNDSIDLMTTNAVVTNTKFTNSKDKGISIGEGSNLIAVNNLIIGSEIGMQSKDTSKAYIYNTSFIGNKKAIDAYHKNWRYSEGGSIYLDKCLFEKNIKNATVGKKSKVVINDSTIDTPENFDTASIQKNKISITHEAFVAPELKEGLFMDKDALVDKARKGYHE